MREILFRGKRTDNGEWLEGFYQPVNNQHNKAFIGFFKTKEQMIPSIRAVISETLGQYTGLNDKNGKKVFEGDIVKNGFERYVVKWNAEQCRFDLYTNKNDIQCGFNVFSQKYFEIIGNLQDNPELLGDK